MSILNHLEHHKLLIPILNHLEYHNILIPIINHLEYQKILMSILNHLEYHKILNSFNHGFFSDLSCESKIYTIHNFMILRDFNNQMDCAVLDFSRHSM